MSLIKCPECGKEISDLAIDCPNCGMPMLNLDKAVRQKKTWKKLRLTSIITGIIGIFLILTLSLWSALGIFLVIFSIPMFFGSFVGSWIAPKK